MGSALNESAWSATAASNDGIDSTIGTVANTSSPTSVDDWVRGLMASRARARLDQGGALVAGGTSTALTVTTNQSLSSSHIANGLRLCVRTASAATGAATIAVDGLTAVDIKKNDGTAIASGEWASGSILDLVYSSTASAFIVSNSPAASTTRASLGLATSDSPQFAAINLGDASDTTIARSAAGRVTVEGAEITGRVLLETAAFGSVASKDIALDAYPGYTSYELVIHKIQPATDNVSLRMTMSTDGGSTFLSSNYAFNLINGGAAGAINTLYTAQASWSLVGGNIVGNASNEGVSGVVRIYNAAGTGFYPNIQFDTVTIDSSSGLNDCRGAGTNTAANDITDIRLLFGAGNIVATGSYSLYGIR